MLRALLEKIGPAVKHIFQFFAWISLLIGVIFTFVILIGGGTPEAPRIMSFVALLLGIFYWSFFYMVAWGVYMLESIRGGKKDSHAMPD